MDDTTSFPAPLKSGPHCEIRRDIATEDYHQHPAVSHSKLEVLRRHGPARYYEQFHRGQVVERETPAMQLGTLIHDIALHPDALGDRIIEIPEKVLSSSGSRAGKAWHSFAAEHAHKILLKTPDYVTAKKIRDGIYRNVEAAKLLQKGHEGGFESKVFFDDEDTGLDCRGMIDRLTPDWIVDLKTTSRPILDFGAIALDARKLGWARQGALYRVAAARLTGDILPFFHVVVQTSPPYSCVVFQLAESWFGNAHVQNREELIKLDACYQRKSFITRFEQGALVTLQEPTDYSAQWEVGSDDE